MSTKELIKYAFYKTIPVMVGYIVLGFGMGIMLKEAGFGYIWVVAMCLLIYAGSMQYVGVSLISAPASLIMTFITSFVIQARHIFYSLSMIKKYHGAGKYKPYLFYSLTDETYALISSDTKLDNEKNRYFAYFLISFFNQCYWFIGCSLGNLLATSLPFPTEGVSFSMTCIFVASYTELLLSGKNRVSAVIGLVVSFIARLFFNSDIFLIPAMIGITVILLLFRNKLESKEVLENE